MVIGCVLREGASLKRQRRDTYQPGLEAQDQRRGEIMRAEGPAHWRQQFYFRPDRTREKPGAATNLLNKLQSTPPTYPRQKLC
jgi:hypothetical protein